MAGESRHERPGARQRRNVAEALVAMVRDSLAKGETPPWRKPWVGGFGSHRAGRRGAKGKYKRWNAWSTWIVAAACGYRSERWYTESQGTKLGWRLKAGSPGASLVVPLMRRGSEEDRGFGGDWGNVTVYNHEAFDGAPLEPEPAPWDNVAGVARVIALYRAVGMDLRTAGHAFYCFRSRDGDEDFIGLPPAETFHSAAAWAGTALHELVHWTGHASRLARLDKTNTEAEYALEELVAELGSAMLAAELRLAAGRIDDDEHHAYLTIWAQRIQEDPDALPTALERANSAVDFLRDVAESAFSLTAAEAATASVGDVPRAIRDGSAWRGAASTRFASRRPGEPSPAIVIGRDAALAIAKWWQAALHWREDIRPPVPVLLVTGAPGDGAESLVDWVFRFMIGDSSAASLGIVAAEGPLTWPSTPGPAWEVRPLLCGDENRLPAWAFPPSGTAREAVAPLGAMPDSGAEALVWLAGAPLRYPSMVVGRYLHVDGAKVPAGVFVADLTSAPVPKCVAHWCVAKSDPRMWYAVRHRRLATTRAVEAWTPRLRTSAAWLDGRIHRVRQRLDRVTFIESGPIAPAVLHAAQAVLDALVREGHRPAGLPDLVREAAATGALRTAAALIPLDVLMGPVFGCAGADRWPADRRPPLSYARIRLVVQLLQLCPELSRGSKSLALMLMTSMDDDLAALVGEINALLRSHQSKSQGRIVCVSHSWSCDTRLRPTE